MMCLHLVYYGHVLMQDLSVFLTHMRCQCVFVLLGFSTLGTVQSAFSHFFSNFSSYISNLFSNICYFHSNIGIQCMFFQID